MYKESMDGGTLLFKGDTYCKAYNLEYLNQNYNYINSNLQDVKDIYYKCNDSRNSWINYKRAILKEENKNIPYVDRILLALQNDLLSGNLEEIPETEYTDYLGYKYNIGPRDGMDSSSMVRKSFKILPSNIEKNIDYDADKKCYRLVVNFRTDVRNAIIIFNGLFQNYELYQGSNTTIAYYEKDGLVFPKDNDGIYRTDWCNIIPYIWEDVYILSREEQPIKRDNEWLVFSKPFDTGCLLFYNKVMCFYEVNKYNECYVRITSVDIGNTNNFELNQIDVVRVVDRDKKPLKQQRLLGFFSESERMVYFPSAIDSALITYNGTHHSFLITPDKKTVKFRIPSDINLDIDTEIDEESNIFAINWYSGVLTLLDYETPQAELAKVANELLNSYKNRVKNAESKAHKLERERDLVFDDYDEHIVFDRTNPHIFKLKYIPQSESIKLFINGVYYDRDVYYNYHENLKSIEWTYDERHGGFDITDGMDIHIIYDLYYSDNGITDIEEFKTQNSTQ